METQREDPTTNEDAGSVQGVEERASKAYDAWWEEDRSRGLMGAYGGFVAGFLRALATESQKCKHPFHGFNTDDEACPECGATESHAPQRLADSEVCEHGMFKTLCARSHAPQGEPDYEAAWDFLADWWSNAAPGGLILVKDEPEDSAHLRTHKAVLGGDETEFLVVAPHEHPLDAVLAVMREEKTVPHPPRDFYDPEY